MTKQKTFDDYMNDPDIINLFEILRKIKNINFIVDSSLGNDWRIFKFRCKL